MKIVKYLFFIAWTLWSAHGILNNYAHYKVEEWIIVIVIVSLPYILLLRSIHKKRIRERKEYPENPWQHDDKGRFY